MSRRIAQIYFPGEGGVSNDRTGHYFNTRNRNVVSGRNRNHNVRQTPLQIINFRSKQKTIIQFESDKKCRSGRRVGLLGFLRFCV